MTAQDRDNLLAKIYELREEQGLKPIRLDRAPLRRLVTMLHNLTLKAN